MKRLVTVVETRQFATRATKIWSEEELDAFTSYIAANPEAGDIVAGTGGVRKVRWSSQGRGKRGGVRIIYFFHSEASPLFLLDLYAKNQQSDLNAQDKKELKTFVETLLRRTDR
jgi:hypothetical protein